MAKPEHTFQISVKKMAAEVIIEPHLFRAFDRSKNASGMQHMHEAARGIRAGTPDTEILFARGAVNVELKKWATGHLKAYAPSEAQEREINLIRSLGLVAGVAHTHRDVIELWREAGLRLSPIADKSAEARDASFAAKMPELPKKRASKPMEKKPSSAKIRRVNALRDEVPF